MVKRSARGSDAIAILKAFVAESELNMTLLDRGGKILEISRGQIERLGPIAETFRGRTVGEVFGNDAVEFTNLIDRAAKVGEAPRPLTRQKVAMPDGGTKWVETQFSPWRSDDGEIGGVICINRDITDEWRGQLELARAEAMLEAVVESMPMLLAVQDLETGVFVRVNKVTETFLGVPREAVIGRTLPPPVPAEAAARRAARIAEASQSDGLITSEEEAQTGAGEFRTLVVHRRMIADREGVRHLLSLAEDITDRKQADAKIQAALAQAEAANLAKSVFLATMSHEIRTPLNGVLGMAQVMARDKLSPAQRERLEVVRQSGEILLTILSDLLDLSKIEAGKLELEAIEFDLTEAVDGAASAFCGLANAKGLQLDLDVDAAIGTYIGDPTRIRQIVSNLISNAIKFTDVGAIQVKARCDEGSLLLSVADSGPGMSEEVLSRLFEKFTQADSSTTRRYGGTGLGLAICRELAERMGGTIHVESRLAQGTTFVVSLPLQPIGPAREERPIKPSDLAEISQSIRVLAAEDNSTNQLVLKTLLEQVGVEITLVANGVEAIEAFRRGGWDLVLMDVQMPVMDGVKATSEIRRFERQTGAMPTPIIALTANAMEHQKAEYLACGMDAMVSKPIRVEELIAAMEAALDGAEPAPSRAVG